LRSDTTIRLNLQENQNGLTLLGAAVAEDNYDAVKWLLGKGAKVEIKDHYQMAPIHLCMQDVNSKGNAAIILAELLSHGANPNDEAIFKHPNSNTGTTFVPLMRGITNSACTKILMEHGANLYYKDSFGYPIWRDLFVLNFKNGQNFQVAKYIIIEKKMPAPDTIFVTYPNKIPKFANNLVENMDTFGDTQLEKDKAEILAYLAVHGKYK